MTDRDRRRIMDPLAPAPAWTDEDATPIERPYRLPSVIVECRGFECLNPDCANCRHHDCHVCGKPAGGHP